MKLVMQRRRRRRKREMELKFQKKKKRRRMNMDGDAAAAAPDLSWDLLDLISRKLTSIYDRVIFRSVCRSWRLSVGPVWDHIQFRSISSPSRASAAVPGDLHLPQPCLILPPNFNNNNTAPLSFFNPCHRRIYDFYLPEAQSKLVFGSSHGWLVLIDDDHIRRVSLLNPITRAQVLLPPLPPPPQIPLFLTIPKVLLSFNPALPPLPPRHRIVLIWYTWFLLLFREGADHWVVINTLPILSKFGEMEYFKEKIYLFRLSYNLQVLNLTSLKLRMITYTHSPRIKDFILATHLVETAGDLLLIYSEAFNRTVQRPVNLKLQCRVFKLDKSGGKLKWVRAGRDGLRDNTLFMSCMQTRSICARDFRGVRANQFYFVDKEFRPLEDPSDLVASTRVFDVVDGVGCNTKHESDSAMDGLYRRLCAMPGLTWIVPSFH